MAGSDGAGDSGSVGVGSAGVSVPSPGAAGSDGTGSTGSLEGVAEGSSAGRSAAKAAGSAAVEPPRPGSTVSSRSPAGSLAETLPPALIRTSTPLEGPTQRGSVLPRTPARPVSVRPSRSVSSGTQGVQFPSAADLVRTSTAPVTLAAGSVQVMPSMLNGAVSRLPRTADVPSSPTFSEVARTSVFGGPDLASVSTEGLPVTPSKTRTPATAEVATAAVIQILRFEKGWSVILRFDLKSYPKDRLRCSGHDPLGQATAQVTGDRWGVRVPERAHSGITASHGCATPRHGPPAGRSLAAVTSVPRVLAVFDELLREAAPDRRGALWQLAELGRELDANLVRLPPGGAVGAHQEDVLDVLLVAVAGGGRIEAGANRWS